MSNHGAAWERDWLRVMSLALVHGESQPDRTGVGRRTVFAPPPIRADLREGFPASTVKKLMFHPMAAELSAFLGGCEKLSEFKQRGCNIWDMNAEQWHARGGPPDSVGRIYGVQWRRWRGPNADEEVDQLRNVVGSLRQDPRGRRHIVTAWNPGELKEMCLPPCHVFFQFYPSACAGRFLDCQVYLRSLDLALGLPFDVASYALLTHIVANEVGRRARHVTIAMGDAHVYENHVDGVRQLLLRDPMPPPTLQLSKDAGIDSFMAGDAVLLSYLHHDPVKFQLN